MENGKNNRYSYVSVGIDKGRMKIRFNSKFSRAIWNKERKDFYVGLTHSEKNQKTTEAIALTIENDIRAENLDVTLNRYRPENRIKEKNGIDYDPHRAEMSLLDLYDSYYESVIEGTIAPATTVTYERFRKAFALCPQDINDQVGIIKCLYGSADAKRFERLSNLTSQIIEWGQLCDHIPEGFVCKIEDIKKHYKKKYAKYRPPAFIFELLPNYIHNYQIKAFTDDEVILILRSLEEYARSEYSGGKTYPIVPGKNAIRQRLSEYERESRRIARDYFTFKILTGCRSGEASGFKWKNVSPNRQEIYFTHNFCRVMYDVKALKTAKLGLEDTEARVFPCGKRLTALLEEMHDSRLRTGPDDYVFFNYLDPRVKYPFHSSHSTSHWSGMPSKHKEPIEIDGREVKFYQLGVVGKLAIIDRKLTQYLSPYATRSTWIMKQLKDGMPIKNVAELAGNSAKIILDDYISYVPNAAPPTEFDW